MKSDPFSCEKSCLEKKGILERLRKNKELIYQRDSDFLIFLNQQERERERELLKRMSQESLFGKKDAEKSWTVW